jgi:hypothetical protein
VTRRKEGGAYDWMLWFAVLLGIWAAGWILGLFIHAL